MKDYVSLWRNPVIGAVIGGVVGGACGYLTRKGYAPDVQAIAPVIVGSAFALAGSLSAMAYDLKTDLRESNKEKSSQIETIVEGDE